MFESPSLPLYPSLQLFPLMSSHKDHPADYASLLFFKNKTNCTTLRI